MDASTTMMLMPLLAIFSQSDKTSWLSYLPLFVSLLIPLLAKVPLPQNLLPSCIRPRSPLSFTAKLRLSYWDTEVQSFVRNFAIVLWEWNRLNKTVNCRSLLEESISTWREDPTSYTMPLFIDDATNRFWHADRPSILYSMWVETISDRDGHVLKDIVVRIEFTTPLASPTTVVEHVEFIMTEAKRLEKERNRTQRVLVSTDSSVGEGRDERRGPRDPVPLMAYEFNTTSSFDNFFAEEATLVQNDLKHFLDDKEAYQRSGRPWTYTVLNEGPPGVGKTKMVKAIAALTGYTLIVINLAHIQTVQMLYELFHTSTLAGETVPHDKRIYYLPELDTQLVDLVKAREPATAALVPVGPAPPKQPTLTDTKKITLGEILNVLDGVPERHGHILVLDTNHLKELDPALIRPGRIDRILSWKKMSAASVRRFLENYYSEPVPPATKLPDRAFSAAELQSLVAQHGTLKEWMGRKKLKSAPCTQKR